MPHTELAGSLAHHLPQATHGVLFHQEFLNLKGSDHWHFLLYISCPSPPPHNFSLHNNLPIICWLPQRCSSQSSQLPLPSFSWCSPKVLVQSSDSKAGGCCCPGSTMPCQLLLSPVSQGCWGWMSSQSCPGCCSGSATAAVSACPEMQLKKSPSVFLSAPCLVIVHWNSSQLLLAVSSNLVCQRQMCG